MTLRQISEAAGCGEKTVRRYAHDLWPTRVFAGGANLSESESVELMAILPKRNMVSGQMTGHLTGQKTGRFDPKKLPSGAQLHEIRLMSEAGKLSAAQIQEILGVTIVKSLPPQSTEPYLPKEATSKRLLELAQSLDKPGAQA